MGDDSKKSPVTEKLANLPETLVAMSNEPSRASAINDGVNPDPPAPVEATSVPPPAADPPAPPPENDSGGSLPPLPLHRSWGHSLLIWSLRLLPIILAGLVGYLAGLTHGMNKTAKQDPFASYCYVTPAMMTPAAMHRRNLVWQTWNDAASVGKTPETKVAAMLALMLSQDTPELLRVVVSSIYGDKAEMYAADALSDSMENPDPVERAKAILAYSRADAQAAELIREVLCDGNRVSAYLSGERIPLETMPDGTVP